MQNIQNLYLEQVDGVIEQKELKTQKYDWFIKLLKYHQKINNEDLQKEEIPGLLNEIYMHHEMIKEDELEYPILSDLKQALWKIKPLIAAYYDCSIEQIYIGDLNVDSNQHIEDYFMVLGNINVLNKQNIKFSNLKYVYGDIEASQAVNINMDKLLLISNHAYFSNALDIDLSNLLVIGGDACFRKANVITNSHLQVNGQIYGRNSDNIKIYQKKIW